MLAELAQSRMRAKMPELTEALAGNFGLHHGAVARQVLDHIEFLDRRVGGQTSLGRHPARRAVAGADADRVGPQRRPQPRHLPGRPVPPHRPPPWAQQRRRRRGHSILTAIWHMLSTGQLYEDLGPDYFERRCDPQRRVNRLVRQLEQEGYSVDLERAA